MTGIPKHCLLAAGLMLGGHALADPVAVSGDLRLGYYDEARTDRSGAKSSNGEGRMRLRIAAEAMLAPGWEGRVRLAGRYATGHALNAPYLRFHAPTRTGARFGDTTLDELYLRRVGDDWRVTVGRFQSKFELPGVASKSLDHKDSPNVGINWTDGVHVAGALTQRWQGHLVLHYQHERGSGQVARAPLDFSRSRSRVGSFVGIADRELSGPWVQRMVGVTWLPAALADDGVGSRSRRDYVALDAKLAAAWPLADRGSRVLVAGEIGYAPNRPREAVVGSGVSGRADGVAWQASVNLHDLWPGHHIGVVYGRVGGGWLLSPDFRNNDELAEVRYQWRINPSWSMEARYRIRDEIDAPPTAQRDRRDRDFYIRLSGRF